MEGGGVHGGPQDEFSRADQNIFYPDSFFGRRVFARGGAWHLVWGLEFFGALGSQVCLENCQLYGFEILSSKPEPIIM